MAEFSTRYCNICKENTEHTRPNLAPEHYSDPAGWTCTKCGAKGQSR